MKYEHVSDGYAAQLQELARKLVSETPGRLAVAKAVELDWVEPLTKGEQHVPEPSTR